MARHRGFVSSLNQFNRGMYRMAKAAERAQRIQIREMERQLKLQAKQFELQSHLNLYNALVKFEHDILNMHLSISPRVDWESQLVASAFHPDPIPDIKNIKVQYELEAKRKIKSLIGLFSKSKRLQLEREAAKIIEYGEQKVQQIMDEYQKKQEERAKAHQQSEDKRISGIESLIDGDSDTVLDVIQERFSTFEDLPIPLSVSVRLLGPNTIVLKTELPPLDTVPESVAQLLKSGKLTSKKKSETARNTLYVQMSCSLALRLIGEVFGLLPSIQSVQVDGVLSGHDPRDGHEKEQTVMSTVCAIETFEKINLTHVSPMDAIRSFTSRMNTDRQYRLAQVIPFTQINEKIDANTVDLQEISPEGFELLIRDLCQRMGMESIVTKASHDGGIDVIAVDPTPLRGGRFVIQCKRYRNVVPVDVVRDLYGAMTHENASKGIVITTSHFSQDCYSFAAGKPIDLIDRQQLEKLLRDSGYNVLEANVT